MKRSKKIKDFLTLGSARLISGIVFGLFWLFLASIIQKEEYGEIGYLMSIVNVVGIIAMLGLGTLVVIYEPKKENVFPASVVIVFFSSMIGGGISYILTQNILVSILIVGLVLFSIMTTGLNSKQRYSDLSRYTIVRAAVSVAFAIALFQFLGIEGVLLGFLVGVLIGLKELRAMLKNRKVEFSTIKPKIRIAAQLLVIRSSRVFLKWGDKIVIGTIFGFTVLGSYYFAAQYLFLIEAMPRAIGRYLLPQEAKGQKNKMIKIFSIATAAVLTVLSITITPYAVNALLPQYQESIQLIQILSISLIPFTIATIQVAEFLGKENAKIVLIGAAFQAGLYFSFIIVLGNLFGLTGIAIGYVIVIITRVVFNFFVGKHYRNKNYNHYNK